MHNLLHLQGANLYEVTAWDYSDSTAIGCAENTWGPTLDDTSHTRTQQSVLKCLVDPIQGRSVFSEHNLLQHVKSSGKFSFTAVVNGKKEQN